jgi:hypothetical protein
MAKANFIKLLQKTAKEQSALSKEKWVPDFLSDLSNFTVINLWKVLLIMAIMSALGRYLWQNYN